MKLLFYYDNINFVEEEFSCKFRKKDTFYSMPELHSHDFYEMYYLVSGERRYFIQDTVFPVHAKGFVFIKPSLMHKTSFSNDGVHTRYFASIPRHWLEDIDSALPPFFLCEDMPSLEYMFSQLQREGEGLDDLSHIICRAISVQIITTAFRAYRERQDGTDPFVNEVASYIKKNIRSDLSLESIAEHMHLSATYFSSLFHKKTGMRLSDFIRSSRIAVAADILKKGGSVSYASLMAGYSDPTYFKDVFRSQMKISPSGYKKRFQQ